MNYMKCDACGNDYLRDQLAEVEGAWLCPGCAAAPPEDELPEAAETACDAEAGDAEAANVAGAHEPEGGDGAAGTPRRVMPAWVKAVVLLIVALAAFGVFQGVRLVRARSSLEAAKEMLFTRNDAGGALAAARRAYEILPNRTFQAYLSYFTGVDALYREDNKRAVECLAAVNIPLDEQEWSLKFMQTRARMNLAFDQKQYDVSLAYAVQMLNSGPGDPMLVMQAASAAAACYAQQGSEEFRKFSLDCLEQVRAMTADSPDALKARLDYETRRIRHRLETRQILSRREYEAKFGKPGAAGQAK